MNEPKDRKNNIPCKTNPKINSLIVLSTTFFVAIDLLEILYTMNIYYYKSISISKHYLSSHFIEYRRHAKFKEQTIIVF